MPMDRKRYPADWEAISNRIRFERAKGVCEQCGAPHNELILRSVVDKSRWLRFEPHTGIHYTPGGHAVRMSEMPDEFDEAKKYTKVVLTVHHIGADKPDGTPGDRHDKMDVREENLIALCQRCHFIADLDIHIVEARKKRLSNKQKRIEATGQLSLF